jgi:hypothetical protein
LSGDAGFILNAPTPLIREEPSLRSAWSGKVGQCMMACLSRFAKWLSLSRPASTLPDLTVGCLAPPVVSWLSIREPRIRLILAIMVMA